MKKILSYPLQWLEAWGMFILLSVCFLLQKLLAPKDEETEQEQWIREHKEFQKINKR
jgi:hypothetical protein